MLPEEEGEGTMHFMVNVVQPQFNLHSEEAHVCLSAFHSIGHPSETKNVLFVCCCYEDCQLQEEAKSLVM